MYIAMMKMGMMVQVFMVTRVVLVVMPFLYK
jgi:hypothetical protein